MAANPNRDVLVASLRVPNYCWSWCAYARSGLCCGCVRNGRSRCRGLPIVPRIRPRGDRTPAARAVGMRPAEGRILPDGSRGTTAFRTERCGGSRIRARPRVESPAPPIRTLAALVTCAAAAVEIDPALRRVYAYLQDNSAAGYASPWLASALFTGERPAMIAPHSPLIEWRLARPTAGSASPWGHRTRPTIDPSLVFWLLGRTARDAALDSAVRLPLRVCSAASLAFIPNSFTPCRNFSARSTAPRSRSNYWRRRAPARERLRANWRRPSAAI